MASELERRKMQKKLDMHDAQAKLIFFSVACALHFSSCGRNFCGFELLGLPCGLEVTGACNAGIYLQLGCSAMRLTSLSLRWNTSSDNFELRKKWSALWSQLHNQQIYSPSAISCGSLRYLKT